MQHIRSFLQSIILLSISFSGCARAPNQCPAEHQSNVTREEFEQYKSRVNGVFETMADQFEILAKEFDMLQMKEASKEKNSSATKASEIAKPPQSAKTTHEILNAIDKIKGYGILEWAEIRNNERRVFVISYCPFSGLAAVYVHAYYYDDRMWHLFANELLYGTHKVSVESPAQKDELRFHGADGSLVHIEKLDSLPTCRENCNE